MKWVAFILFTLFIIIISVLAYLGLLPTTIDAIPYYDSIGHFLLYGFWGYLFALVIPKSIIPRSGFIIPLGIVLASCVAIVEECFQSLSPIRTFSLTDLGCGLLGISLACVVFNARRRLMLK